MTLMERIDSDMKQAMKDKDKFRLSVIRMVKSSIKYAEIDNKGSSLSDDKILDVLTREVKQRRDSLQEFEKANRSDLVEKVEAEIKILENYLPEQLSEEELETIIKEAIEQVGANTKADMGKVMGIVMPKVKGRADGRIINKLVSEHLS